VGILEILYVYVFSKISDKYKSSGKINLQKNSGSKKKKRRR
jgi:hypothetical protein